MSNEAILLLILIILLLGALPSWPYSSAWGYGPTGVVAMILIVVLVWAVAGGKPLFTASPSASSVNASVQEVGSDLKAAGRNAADSIRNVFQ